MKKIILILLLSIMSLPAEVIKVVPFVGAITYSDESAESIKDSSVLGGVYANIGTLDYLVELSYSYMNTTYKADENLSNLQQHDISLIYGKYFRKFMFKVGAHYTETNDDILGNGIVAILGVGGYKTFGYDKLTYGLDGYYSYYQNRINEDLIISASQAGGRRPPPAGTDVTQSDLLTLIGIIQVTPYLTYFKSISTTMSNELSVKLNYQIASSYSQSEYFSYELSDTFYYKSLFAELYVYGGEMKSGVKDGGLSVYNSLDLMKTGIRGKFGYYFTKNLITTFSYSVNSYNEYKVVNYGSDSTNEVMTAALSYRF